MAAAWRSLALTGGSFDLVATLNSGQVFHMSETQHEGHSCWAGCLGEMPLLLRQTQGKLFWAGPATAKKVRQYLGLEDDLAAMQASFHPQDAPLRAAIAFCPGLRILRQPAWECLATFITSSLKQVPHIRQISLRLRQKYGEKVAEGLWNYPTPAALAQAGETGLREMGLGFRAKSLAATAQEIASGAVNLAKLSKLDTPSLEKALCALPGVGPKIANCVLLFGFARLEAFPVDVWVQRILTKLYFPDQPAPSLAELASFAAQQFGPWGGYAQQYLFHQARLTKLVE